MGSWSGAGSGWVSGAALPEGAVGQSDTSGLPAAGTGPGVGGSGASVSSAGAGGPGARVTSAGAGGPSATVTPAGGADAHASVVPAGAADAHAPAMPAGGTDAHAPAVPTGVADSQAPALPTGVARQVGVGRSSRRAARAKATAWAELLRLPALFTVPGDALAGAAAAAAHADSRTLLAICSSLCLYEAGMALNDWADRAEDAVERPHRPLPSGRIRPTAALTAACALTGAGLSLAARAGRPALAVAVPLAATVWAYDLALKHTPAGPFAMATARGLDLLLGAAATTGTKGTADTTDTTGIKGTTKVTGPRRPKGITGVGSLAVTAAGASAAASRVRRALPSAALLSAHTLAVTTVSRRETQGGSPLAPLGALATTAVLTRLLTHRPTGPSGRPGTGPFTRTPPPSPDALRTALATTLAAAYATTAARPYFHAALNPSPPLTQRAVGGGIRATIPLQAALAARSGATVTALLTTALAPLAARCARKVSVT